MKRSEINTLRERVRAAKVGDRNLDLAIARLWPEEIDRPFTMTTNPQRGRRPPVPKFSSSTDAAVRLLQRRFPGCAWQVGEGPHPDNDQNVASARLMPSFAEVGYATDAWLATAALAIIDTMIIMILDQEKLSDAA